MKTEDRIKLNVKPKSLTLHEQLTYSVTIGTRVDTKGLKANGTLEVRVPYDGEKYFDTAALNRVANLKAKAAQSALIGYIGFSDYERTSLDAHAPGEEFYPIKIPIEIPIADIDRLVTTGSLCVNSIGYTVKEPSGLPVSMDAVLVDDLEMGDWPKASTSFHEQLQLRLTVSSDVGNISQVVKDTILDKVRAAREKAQDSLSDLQKQVSEAGKEPEEELLARRAEANDRAQRLTAIQTELEGLADQPMERFTAENVVKAIDDAMNQKPENLSQATRQQLSELRWFVQTNLGAAQLVYLGLNWPYAEQEALDAPTDRRRSWQYNPESKRMEVHDVRLWWDSDMRMYRAGLHLNLYRPAEAFPVLQGDLVLQTAKLLSGLKVQWLDTNGRESKDVRTEVKTSIKMKIEKIELTDVFHRRTFSPSRYLRFKSVLPNRDRLRDVENVLNDVGLTILEKSYGDPDLEDVDVAKGCWIVTTKRGVGEHLRVWVFVTGTATTGTHTITYDDGRQKLDEHVPLGDTEVKIFARMTGDSSSINAILNDIQRHLKQRFASARLV
jgi:hypothetical protein